MTELSPGLRTLWTQEIDRSWRVLALVPNIPGGAYPAGPPGPPKGEQRKRNLKAQCKVLHDALRARQKNVPYHLCYWRWQCQCAVVSRIEGSRGTCKYTAAARGVRGRGGEGRRADR